jgi:hypothetical protein
MRAKEVCKPSDLHSGQNSGSGTAPGAQRGSAPKTFSICSSQSLQAPQLTALLLTRLCSLQKEPMNRGSTSCSHPGSTSYAGRCALCLQQIMPATPRSPSAVVVKLLLDQGVMAPLGTALFFMGMKVRGGAPMLRVRCAGAD